MKRGFEDTNTKEKGVVLTKDDKAHGSLLIMNELIRSASIEGEVCELCCYFRKSCSFLGLVHTGD